MIRYSKGRFSGKFDSARDLSVWKVLQWKLFQRPSRKTNIEPLPVADRSDALAQSEDFICWLSHASFLIQLGGRRILIDPVFGDIPFYKRQIPAPYDISQLGKIDYLLLSHTHYDHFDVPSLKAVAPLHPKALLPLKMGKLLQKKTGIAQTAECDWFESFEEGGVKITLVPAKHWGRRGIFDKNRVLWGGYVLEYGGRTVYFAGDTAYGEHFKTIGEKFDIDIALLPIGAYKPEFIMKHNHLNPQEAFDAFSALGARRMIPMHYGTFKLTDEPLDEPLQWMETIAKKHPGKVLFLKPGEVWRWDQPEVS